MANFENRFGPDDYGFYPHEIVFNKVFYRDGSFDFIYFDTKEDAIEFFLDFVADYVNGIPSNIYGMRPDRALHTLN